MEQLSIQLWASTLNYLLHSCINCDEILSVLRTKQPENTGRAIERPLSLQRENNNIIICLSLCVFSFASFLSQNPPSMTHSYLAVNEENNGPNYLPSKTKSSSLI